MPTLRPSDFTPEYLLKRNENMYPQKDSYKNIHSSFLTIDTNEKQLIHTSINSRMDKWWYILMMEHFTGIRAV